MRISTALPKWLAVGPWKTIQIERAEGLSRVAIFFAIYWNVWREVCSIGIYVTPSLINRLESHVSSPVPLSLVLGIAIGLGIGVPVHGLHRFMARKHCAIALTIIATMVTGGLACGLFSDAMLTYEAALANWSTSFTNSTFLDAFPTDAAFTLSDCTMASEDCIWASDALPMALLVPFGYSTAPSWAQLLSFCGLALFLLLLHSLSFLCAIRRGRRATLPRKVAKTSPGKMSRMESDTPDHDATPNDSISDAGAPAAEASTLTDEKPTAKDAEVEQTV